MCFNSQWNKDEVNGVWSFDYGHISSRSDPYASGDRLSGSSLVLPVKAKVEEKRTETILIDDLLCQPGRQGRPDRLVVMVRGPPGSGKSYVSRLIKVGIRL